MTAGAPAGPLKCHTQKVDFGDSTYFKTHSFRPSSCGELEEEIQREKGRPAHQC
jgi:hypothetical protein